LTQYVCTHHVGFALWIGLSLVAIYCIIDTSITLSHPLTQPDFNLPIAQFEPLDQAYMKYVFAHTFIYLHSGLFIVIQIISIYFANERYHWLGMKECKRC